MVLKKFNVRNYNSDNAEKILLRKYGEPFAVVQIEKSQGNYNAHRIEGTTVYVGAEFLHEKIIIVGDSKRINSIKKKFELSNQVLTEDLAN